LVVKSPALLAVTVFCTLSAACGGNSASPSSNGSGIGHDPAASGATVAPEVGSTIHLLPNGTLYISVTRGSAQASPPATGSEGVLYVDTTAQPNAWYFISARPVGQRGTPNPATGVEAYATADLPPLPNVNQHEAVLKTDLAAGGRTQAHKSGGVEMIFVVSGTVEVHAGTFSPKTLHAGQGAFVLENTPLQVFNPGTKPATIIDFYLLPAGKPLSQPFPNSV
jgi:quercetin dioxygenase-like cupin family protein